MSTTTNSVGFTDSEFSDEIPPSTFRVTGVISFLMGLVSVGALASTMLLIFPILGLVFGLIAIRPARASRGKPGGRVFALIGMTLSLLFGCWSYSYFAARDHYLGQQAKVFGEQWLIMIRHGQPEAAYELTKSANTRQMENMSLASFYTPENKEAYEQYSGFVSNRLTRNIIDAETDPEWVFEGVQRVYMAQRAEQVMIAFSDKTGTLDPVSLTLCRLNVVGEDGTIEDPDQMSWHVANFSVMVAAETTGFE